MNEVWEAALSELRDQLSPHTYDAWLAPVVCEGIEGGVVRLRIPHRFFADWIAARYLPEILGAVARSVGAPTMAVEWVVGPKESPSEALYDSDSHAVAADDDEPEPVAPPRNGRPSRARVDQARVEHQRVEHQRVEQAAPRRASRPPRDRRTVDLPFAEPTPAAVAAPVDDYALNPRYRFENFIVGPSNQLAHAASVAASSAPGKRYNPLFIYSKVGLGKTHLVNAVGHRVREARPDARILFLSAERFTNEFISALQHRRIDEFRARYRSQCDVLVIDDIQFLAGREQTQEEFFHTFNALYHADKQIVVTSDMSPQQIHEMEERLISRFQWGLVADIQAPALDTRIAILREKAEQERLRLDDTVALFIAQRVQSNVRELEGTLLRLVMRADLEGRTLDLELARRALGDDRRAEERQLTVEDVQRAACDYYGITMKELLSDRRHRGVSLPRMVAMFVSRERLKLSYPDIGRRFGGKDHTTVMSAHRKIGALVEIDEEMKRAVERIETRLGLR